MLSSDRNVKRIHNFSSVSGCHVFSYVQQRIREQSQILRRLLVDRGGYFLVSGSSKNMPQAVREALAEALGDEEIVQSMVKAGRYQEETWA